MAHFPLRDRRRHSLRDLRRVLLLVSESHRPDAAASGWASSHFWLFVIGFHLTFDFMHIPGLLGMPRRIYTYEPGRGWDTLEPDRVDRRVLPGRRPFWCSWRTSFVSYWRGARAGNDPWDAWTLEWSVSSPPPAYNFASIPTVAQPPAAVGPEASGGPGQPLRVTGTNHASRDGPYSQPTGTRRRCSLEPARSRQGRHVSVDHRRVGDLHHLRRRLSLLSRQEPDRTDAARRARGADLLHRLPALEQPDHPPCREASSTRRATARSWRCGR